MKRLLLHIGAPKCGSTYFQRVMQKNRESLAAHRMSYPALEQGGHPGNGAGFAGLTEAQLADLFADADHVILSHEDLLPMASKAKGTAERLEILDVDVCIVAFLRPFSAFAFGDYSQFIKQNLDRDIEMGVAFDGRSFEEFVVARHQHISVPGWLKAWQRLFPRKPLVLASHKEMRAVFERETGIRDLNWNIPHDVTNPSLRMTDCADIVHAINTGMGKPHIHAMLRAALKQTKLPDPARSAAHIKWIEALYAKQNETLLDAFGFDNRL